MFSIVFTEATTGPFLSQLNPLHLTCCFLNTFSPISPVHPVVLISWIAFQIHQNNLLKSCTIWDKMFLIQSILAWNTLTVLHKNNGNIYCWRYVLKLSCSLHYRTCHDDSFVNRHEHHTQVCVHKYPHKWVSLPYMAAHTKPFHMDRFEPLSVDMDHMNQNDKLFHICDFHSWGLFHISTTRKQIKFTKLNNDCTLY